MYLRFISPRKVWSRIGEKYGRAGRRKKIVIGSLLGLVACCVIFATQHFLSYVNLTVISLDVETPKSENWEIASEFRYEETLFKARLSAPYSLIHKLDNEDNRGYWILSSILSKRKRVDGSMTLKGLSAWDPSQVSVGVRLFHKGAVKIEVLSYNRGIQGAKLTGHFFQDMALERMNQTTFCNSLYPSLGPSEKVTLNFTVEQGFIIIDKILVTIGPYNASEYLLYTFFSDSWCNMAVNDLKITGLTN